MSDNKEFYSGRRYRRVGSHEVLAITNKVGSTSLTQDYMVKQGGHTKLQTGDHVLMYARDPRDRLVSGWKWFMGSNCHYKDMLEKFPEDHRILFEDAKPTFPVWVHAALRHWNSHWAPQTEIHERWREFDVRDLATYKGSHAKQTRKDNSWAEYYDEATLALVNEVYSEDLEMWKEIKDGTNTGTKRLL